MQEISKVLAEKYDEVIEKINVFSKEYLNEEYKKLCTKATNELFSNFESNVKKGKSLSWAAGIVHAIGSVNNLFDSKEEPYIKALDLYKEFGISSSTGSSKSKEVRSLLDINESNAAWIITNKAVKEATAEEEAALTIEANKEEALTIEKEANKIAVSKDYIEAQNIVNIAWQEKNYKSKTKYAKEALSIYEDCADAYIILANNTSLKAEERKELLRRAVKAGANVLNITDLENADKRVFKLPIAEPYFGAKYTLANYLWQIGEFDEAIKEASEILKYDEEDKLLVRGILTTWLIMQNKYTEAKEILDRYENDNLAVINYNRAVVCFMMDDAKAAESALRRAYVRNPYVVDYLLRRKNIKNIIRNAAVLGSEEEAKVYAQIGLNIWNSKEIKQWLKERKSDFDILGLK